MSFIGNSDKSSTTNTTNEFDSSQDTISQQGQHTNSTNVGDIHQSISASKSNINYTATDHGSVLAGRDVALNANNTVGNIAHQAIVENRHVINDAMLANSENNANAFNSIDNVTRGAQELAETALFTNYDTIDLASRALENANENMLDVAIQSFDVMDGANDRVLGATERLGERFASNTSDVFETALLHAENANYESTQLARDLSGDFMLGLQDAYDGAFDGTRGAYEHAFEGNKDAFSDSLSAVSRNHMYTNDSIMALAEDSSELVSRAYGAANERFTNAMQNQNEQTLDMVAGLMSQSNAQSAAQFDSAIDQITAINQDAYKLVQESAKTEGERTTDTLIKFAVGGIALVGVAFAITRKGK